LGVVEHLTEARWMNQHRSVLRNRQSFSCDPYASGSLEDEVELILLRVSMPGVRGEGRKPPQTRSQLFGGQLLSQVRVRNLHHVRLAPEGVTRQQHRVRF